MADCIPIDAYDDAEKRALTRVSYPAIRSFRPSGFQSVSFPTNVTDELELARYVDIMSEVAPMQRYLFDDVYSRHEAAAIDDVATQVLAFTAQRFGRATHPFMSLMTATDMYRLIWFLRETVGRENLRVLEIGPGAGYLGALLIRDGFDYTSCDNTQALYLWQTRLFHLLSKGDFDDWARHETAPEARSAAATTIPWWHFAEMHGRSPLAFDIIVCNRAMGEMDPWAVWYIAKMARRMLAQSEVGAFLFTDVGVHHFFSVDGVVNTFLHCGFSHLTSPAPEPHHLLFQPQSDLQHRSLQQKLREHLQELASDVPPVRHTEGQGLKALDFLKLRPESLAPSYAFMRELYEFIQRNEDLDWEALFSSGDTMPQAGIRSAS